MLVFAGLVYIVPPNIIPLPKSTISENLLDSSMLIPDSTIYDSLLFGHADTLAKADSIPARDSLNRKDTIPKSEIPNLTLPDKTVAQLHEFFHKASEAKKAGKTVRVLHIY